MVLHIPHDIWQKLRLYTELSLPNEITGIGTVIVRDPEHLIVTNVYLPRQRTSPTVSTFLDGELNQIITDLLEKDDDSVSQLRFRFHSHAYGEVYWSSEDKNDIESWEAPWVVNLVTNARGDYRIRLDCFSPLRICNYPVELRIDYPYDHTLREACASELREKVTVIREPRLPHQHQRPTIRLGGPL